MNDRDYRSKLRTPKKEIKTEPLAWENVSPNYDFGGFSSYASSLTPSSTKTKFRANTDFPCSPSPAKSNFLRTPSPPLKLNRKSPQRLNTGFKTEAGSTPSPHKASSGADLFGNRSLLDNLPIPEWDDHFLNNFQEDLFFGIGSEDLEGLVRSPLSSPRHGQTLVGNSPFKRLSPAVSPFKSPLLTSSPKFSLDSSPSNFMKTPDLAGSRPLTRQRKLFLQSPERQIPSLSGSSSWHVPLPLSSLDETFSSMPSDSHETTTSIQSISTYLRQLDDEDNEDDYPVKPPAGWTNASSSSHVKRKSPGKGKQKSFKHKSLGSNSSCPTSSSQQSHATQSQNVSGHCSSKKMKVEPQFTLLRPHTELHNHQISLRMAPCTPPNKIKISRDFSQIQTLPSKEQLRVVRTRFRETLNKAVEQLIEKEKAKQSKDQVKVNDPALRSALQRPVMVRPVPIAPVPAVYNLQSHIAHKPPLKKRKR